MTEKGSYFWSIAIGAAVGSVVANVAYAALAKAINKIRGN